MISKEEIEKLVKTEKICMGTENTLKNLRSSNLNKILVSKNCPRNVVEDIESLSEGTEILFLEKNNEELGIICKKPFHISVIGILKR